MYIAGDWGTSNLRLYLCEYHSDGSIAIETRYGAGISQICGDFEERFFNLTQDWFDAYGKMPVLLSGMVGSTIGWKEAPYLDCPVNVNDIAAGRISFTARDVEFSILSGLKTINPLNVNDVMRGEELQLLGWMRSNNSTDGQRLFALPGTHNKWARSENGAISTFLTAFTGELFALLRNHSILITEQSSFNFNESVFLEGISKSSNQSTTQLVHTLFSTRAKQVMGDFSPKDGLSYLSGLIIGCDVAGALDLFEHTEEVIIIGEPTLSDHYKLAIKSKGLEAICCDPSTIAITGFDTIYRSIYQHSYLGSTIPQFNDQDCI